VVDDGGVCVCVCVFIRGGGKKKGGLLTRVENYDPSSSFYNNTQYTASSLSE